MRLIAGATYIEQKRTLTEAFPSKAVLEEGLLDAVIACVTVRSKPGLHARPIRSWLRCNMKEKYNILL